MVTGLCVHAIGAEVSEGRVPAHAAFLSSLHCTSEFKKAQTEKGWVRTGGKRRIFRYFYFPGAKETESA